MKDIARIAKSAMIARIEKLPGRWNEVIAIARNPGCSIAAINSFEPNSELVCWHCQITGLPNLITRSPDRQITR
ncbi:MAG TPA: hypothetical protein VFI72_14895 [Candidatus Angelobacter sp.]|nr:hypothetical protein [Candidatus Angelobacter sp.]